MREKSFEQLDREERERLRAMADAGCLSPDPDAVVVSLYEDDRGWYWILDGWLAGPFRTSAMAKNDACAALYMQAGKAGLRFTE